MDEKTLEELQQLEPSPVDETAPFAENYYFPSQSPRSTSFLGINNSHSLAYYLRRAQRYSSYIFSVFLAAHMTNTSLVPLVYARTTAASDAAVTASSRYLLLTRPYYQSWPLAEPLLILLPLTMHVASGLLLRLHHRRVAVRAAGAETPGERRGVRWPKLSGTSALGFAAVPLITAHTYVTRGLPLLVEGGSSSIALEYVSHGFALLPGSSFIGYMALVGVVGMHVAWGWSRWLELAPGQVNDVGAEGMLRKKRRWYGVNAAGLCMILAWLSGGLGVVARGGKVGGWVGQLYDDLYRRLPILGMRV